VRRSRALRGARARHPPRRGSDRAHGEAAQHERGATDAGTREPGLILTLPAAASKENGRLPRGLRDRGPQARRRLDGPVGVQYRRSQNAPEPVERLRAGGHRGRD
jgi:hypothetical protein